MPETRRIARVCFSLNFPQIADLLRSRIHEERLLGLLILVERFSRGDARSRERIFRFYTRSLRSVNNWDLVDLSADKIAGAYLWNKKKDFLFRLSRSKNLWERRISIVSTYYFIKHGCFSHTLRIAEALLWDKEDLIHKAVGWMLREVGKKDRVTEEAFLRKHYRRMPRTMLRYAIEKFPPQKRTAYLRGDI